MDFLVKHYNRAMHTYKDNPSTIARVIASHIAFDKYYSLTDRAPLYAAAILLHPSLRKAYLDNEWKELSAQRNVDYVQIAVDACAMLWKAYKPLDTQRQADLSSMNEYQQFRYRAFKGISKDDEFERFIKV